MPNITLIQNPIIPPINLKGEGYSFIVSKAESLDGIFQFSDLNGLINHSYINGYLYSAGEQVLAIHPTTSLRYAFYSTIPDNPLPPFTGSGDTLNTGWAIVNKANDGYNINDDLGYVSQKNFRNNIVQSTGSVPTSENYKVPSVKYMADNLNSTLVSNGARKYTFTITKGAGETFDIRTDFMATNPAEGYWAFYTPNDQPIVKNFPAGSHFSSQYSNPVQSNVSGFGYTTVEVRLAGGDRVFTWVEQAYGGTGVNGDAPVQTFKTAFRNTTTNTDPIYWEKQLTTQDVLTKRVLFDQLNNGNFQTNITFTQSIDPNIPYIEVWYSSDNGVGRSHMYAKGITSYLLNTGNFMNLYSDDWGVGLGGALSEGGLNTWTTTTCVASGNIKNLKIQQSYV